MGREWRNPACPDCGQLPQVKDDRWQCACPEKTWSVVQTIHAMGPDRDLLIAKGFQETAHRDGSDKYYAHPWHGIVWIFPDGTWRGEKAQPGQTLEQYLNSLSEGHQ